MSLGTSLPKVTTAIPGPKSKELFDKRVEFATKGVSVSIPCFAERAEGAMIEDVDGNIFLDFVGGIGVMNIGHSNPEVIQAMKDQIDKFTHTSINVISYAPYTELVEKLATMTPGDFKKSAMLVNTGAETSENAVKIARQYTKKTEIVVFTGAFHGRTALTMEMTSKVKPYKLGFGPFPSGIHRASYPYVYRRPEWVSEEDAVKYYIGLLNNFFLEEVCVDETAAIILEPLQGEGGFIPAPVEYIKALRKICDDNNILLVCDEVQTGFARTGKMFCAEYWAEAGVYADLILLAKSMGGGVPIGAIVGRSEIMNVTHVGGLGGTYAGNPVACAASLKVIEIMERENFPAKSAAIGKKVTDRINKMAEKYQNIGDVRGLGAMIGIEFVEDRKTKEPFHHLGDILGECKKNGLLMIDCGLRHNTARFLAPLAITDEQLEAGLTIFENAIAKFCK